MLNVLIYMIGSRNKMSSVLYLFLLFCYSILSFLDYLNIYMEFHFNTPGGFSDVPLSLAFLIFAAVITVGKLTIQNYLHLLI